MAKGQIRKALSGFYYVYYQGETYQTRARGNFRNKNITPLVGDQVVFKSDSTIDGYLLEVLPRKNELIRPPVSNVDYAVIVMSCVEPNFSDNLLDRFLANLAYKKITPVIYLTKTDLLDEQNYQAIKEISAYYRKIGYDVILPNRLDDTASIKEIQRYFPENLTVFMGQTGAGKSTLLNKISPELSLKTAEISKALGRGKHTTRHIELLTIAEGLVGDTAGFSAIDLPEVTAVDLSKLFIEINEASYGCKFRECLHLHEPKCAVKEQVEKKEISLKRYTNYLQFLEEIENRKPIYHREKK